MVPQMKKKKKNKILFQYSVLRDILLLSFNRKMTKLLRKAMLMSSIISLSVDFPPMVYFKGYLFDFLLDSLNSANNYKAKSEQKRTQTQ